MRWAKQTGFTIVELLIVVVVIAILATLTIISYNGISARANYSAAASDLKSISTKINLYATANQDTLPATLADASITEPAGITFEYWKYDKGTQFCIARIKGDVAMYYNSTNTSAPATAGKCSDISSVAGAPLAFTDTTGGIPLSSPISGTSTDVILYSAAHIINTSGSYNTFARLEPSSNENSLTLRTNDTGSTSLAYRLDTDTISNVTSSQNLVRTPGSHIGWVQVRSNMTVREFAFDKAAAHSSISMSPGPNGWSFTALNQFTPSSSSQPIATAVYNTAHDEATRARIMQWFATKYSIPAEY